MQNRKIKVAFVFFVLFCFSCVHNHANQNKQSELHYCKDKYPQYLEFKYGDRTAVLWPVYRMIGRKESPVRTDIIMLVYKKSQDGFALDESHVLVDKVRTPEDSESLSCNKRLVYWDLQQECCNSGCYLSKVGLGKYVSYDGSLEVDVLSEFVVINFNSRSSKHSIAHRFYREHELLQYRYDKDYQELLEEVKLSEVRDSKTQSKIPSGPEKISK